MKFKKLLSFLLAAVLCAALVPSYYTARAEDTLGTYIVVSDSADIMDYPFADSQKNGEVYKGTYVTVTAVSGGYGFIYRNSTGINGFVLLSDLRFVTEDVSVPDGINGIRVKKPDKLIYTEREESFDSSGMEVYAVYENGEELKVTKGIKIYCESFYTFGTKSVRVSYTPASGKTFTYDFSVEVIKIPVEKITVTAFPQKSSYKEHEKLSLSGLTVTVSYLDSRPDRVFTYSEITADSDFTLSACHGETDGCVLEAGTHTFNISYKYSEINTSFDIYTAPRVLTGITMSKAPDSMTVYSKTEIPALTGMEVTAYYDNGETAILTASDCVIDCNPAEFIIGDKNIVKVSFGDFSFKLELRYLEPEITGIQLVLPETLTFILGRDIDISALKVYLVYNSGEKTETSDYTLSEIKPLVKGSQTIVVNCGNFSDVFTIYITPCYSLGDIDGNGAISSADARLALRCAVGYVTLTGNAFTAADVNCDSAVTSADARLILRAAVGLEKFYLN